MMMFKTLTMLMNLDSSETDCDRGSSFYWYSDASDDKSYSIKSEEEQCTMLSI